MKLNKNIKNKIIFLKHDLLSSIFSLIKWKLLFFSKKISKQIKQLLWYHYPSRNMMVQKTLNNFKNNWKNIFFFSITK